MRARQWGRIVNISSGAARGAGAIGVHYNASKAGMEGLTRGYAARLVKEGITVNAVAPSLIATDMMGGRTDLARNIPLGRMGEAEEVAQAVAMVLGNSYMTGTDHRPQWRHGLHLTRAVLLFRLPAMAHGALPAAASTRSAGAGKKRFPLIDRTSHDGCHLSR
jgi:short-subunit dehydrogenase